MKQCFVIMPYGGNDESKQRQFTGVFQSIIAPAARAAGYEPKRSDIAGEPGNITHDIIRDLADSDVVVADLTDPNVFYELGVRHAFRKSGTVHIINASHSLPFDVRGYRAIEYSTDLADIPDIITQITEAISKRAQQSNRPDNPVHDSLPELPLNVRETGDAALREQLKKSQAALEDLHKDHDRLARRLSEIDPAGDAEDQLDVDGLLQKAQDETKYTGRHAILTLRQAMTTGTDSFIQELKTVLKSPYLTQNDFVEIVLLCKEAGLDAHRRATLEVARKCFPHDQKILMAYIDSLDDSPSRNDNERGRILAEKELGIEHKNGLPRFAGSSRLSNVHDCLGLLFNFYHGAGRYDWILSVCESLPQGLAEDTMVLRSRARALAHLNRNEDAKDIYQEALRLDPTDDQTRAAYADFLDDQGRYAEAYAEFERAVLADPDDPRLFVSLAVHILNRGYYRTPDGEIRGPAPRKVRPRAVIPLVLKALEDPSPKLVEDVVRILVRGGAISEAEAIATGQRPQGKFDTAPLDYLLKQIMAQLEPTSTEEEVAPN